MKIQLSVLAGLIVVFLLVGCAQRKAEEDKVENTEAQKPKEDPNRIDIAGATVRLATGDRELAKTVPGVFEGRVVLTPAGKGSADSLFGHTAAATLKAEITSASRTAARLIVRGVYTDGKLSIPFERQIVTNADTGEITVTETADFTGLPKEFAVAEHSLELPLVVGDDEHYRMSAFGGASRVEMFRMDMNDENRRSQYISDKRAFRPYWDIGGVRQLAGSYCLWRANHADTMAYPIEEGEGAPGWADYSELDAGLTVKVLEPAESAPWSMMIDARKGVLTISPRPPDAMPVSGADYGKRTFRFVLTPHASSWPATYACELKVEDYKGLLDYLNQKPGHNNLSVICGALGITKGGTPEEVHRSFIFKERVQPSVVLRMLYRGDPWRMMGVVKDLLGKTVPRRQPFEKWEELAAELLDKINRDGFPAATPAK